MYLKAYKASNIPIYLRDIFMVLTNEEADRILSGKEKLIQLMNLYLCWVFQRVQLKDGEEILNHRD